MKSKSPAFKSSMSKLIKKYKLEAVANSKPKDVKEARKTALAVAFQET